MRNRPEYKQLEQIALDGNYTVEQVQNATKSQVSALLDNAVMSDAFFLNMKNILLKKLTNRNDETDRQFIINLFEGGARTAFRDRFPDAVILKRRENSKRIIEIRLDG